MKSQLDISTRVTRLRVAAAELVNQTCARDSYLLVFHRSPGVAGEKRGGEGEGERLTRRNRTKHAQP